MPQASSSGEVVVPERGARRPGLEQALDPAQARIIGSPLHEPRRVEQVAASAAVVPVHPMVTVVPGVQV